MKAIDIFGESFTFYKDGKKSYSSNFGGLVTLIILVIVSLLILAFGQDFFNRTNPFVLKEVEVNDSFPVYTLGHKNFTAAVRLQTQARVPITDSPFFKLHAIYSWTETINGTKTITTKKLPLIPCTEEMFFSKEVFNQNDIMTYQCVNLDGLKIGGSPNSLSYGYLAFVSYLCAKGKIHFYNPQVDNRVCDTEVPIEEINANNLGYHVYMSYFFQKAIVTTSNYTNGLQVSLESDTFLIDKSISKYINTFFSQSKMKTDYGWILKSVRSESVFNMDNTNSEIRLQDPQLLYHDLGVIFYKINRNNDLYTREYIKIQILAANVGGIIKLFMIISLLIVTSYNEISFLISISGLTSIFLKGTKVINENDKSKSPEIKNSESFVKLNNFVKIKDNNLKEECSINNNSFSEYKVSNEIKEIINLNPIKNKVKLLEVILKKEKEKDIRNEISSFSSTFYYYYTKIFFCFKKNRLYVKKFDVLINASKSCLDINTILFALLKFDNLNDCSDKEQLLKKNS